MFFGNSAKLKAGKSLNLKKNPKVPTYWYVPMTGVTVAGKRVDVPPNAFELKDDGTGGVIIDSGIAISHFEAEVYNHIKAAIEPLIHLPRTTAVDLDLCFQLPFPPLRNLSLPSVVYNFEGGVDMHLPENNTYVRAENDALCLAMVPNDAKFGVLGTIQQQNFHFLYDNAQKKISLEPANCASL
ncbi:aspartic proteinase nepenthesin-1-like [Cryptomeria japonica]|uniref:aspartic proteinase nepenthesin-1-like n=1 Tax=Cryptomeria japonica TaxID=3369 RepID=UPI0025AC4B4A|nr:aspartic proteinase nepenthesin-1-like [Cryptomeria japonica]